MAILTPDELQRKKSAYDKDQYQKFDDVVYSPVRGILAKDGYQSNEDILLFQFNPETISDVKEVEWYNKSSLGFSSNDYLWVKGGERSLNFKLWFEATASVNTPIFRPGAIYGDDTYDTINEVFPRGVMPMVEKLTSFQYPQLIDGNAPRYSTGVKVPEVRFMPPPIAIFIFGEFYMRGIIAGVSTQYTLFDKRLKPLRAECDVTFKVIETDVVQIDEGLMKQGKQIEENEFSLTSIWPKKLRVNTAPIPDTAVKLR